MELSSGIVGRRLSGTQRLVDWRDTTNYAAAVGDLNPRYLDDTTGLVAPPIFVVSLTWPVVLGIQDQLHGAIPPEIVPTMVHASEHIIFHRVIRPGDALRISGEVAAVLPARAGTLLVLRLDAAGRDAAPVFTEFTGALFRGVKCSDGARGVENLPGKRELPELDKPIWEAELPVSRGAPFVYDGCSNIVFPIHTSVSFARAVGLPDIILQGTATLAMAARELLNREADAAPERLKEIACRFSAMVIPGCGIRVRLLDREKSHNGTVLGFQVLNSEGKPALSSGFARIG